MITDKIKAQALAQIKHQIPAEQIAEKLNIPIMLVKEWGGKLTPDDMTALESNIYALESIVNGKVEILDNNEEILKAKLEEAAIELAKQTHTACAFGDMVHAKSVQLCADAVAKLYTTIILKNSSGNAMLDKSTTGNTLFNALMKD